LVWLADRVKSPPFSEAARVEVGICLRKLQNGESLEMPCSRPMPLIGRHCHELRINDENASWRIVYRIDDDFVVITDVFMKTTEKTPTAFMARSRERLARYDKNK
jgi:phage-related protein